MFTPFHNYVLVKRIEEADRTAGGVIIPDQHKKKAQQGIALAVGPGLKMETGATQPMHTKEGDHVLFAEWSGAEIRIDGQNLVLLRDNEIFGRRVKQC